MVGNSLLSLFNWNEDFDPMGPKPTRMPVWVEFPNLPAHLVPILKLIVEPLGKLLGQRPFTDINPRWHLQVLIEMEVLGQMPEFILIKDSEGNIVRKQEISYKNLPNACFKCMRTGHFVRDCPETKKKATADSHLAPSQGQKNEPDSDGFQTVSKKNKLSKTVVYNKVKSRNFYKFSPLLVDLTEPTQIISQPHEKEAEDAGKNRTDKGRRHKILHT